MQIEIKYGRDDISINIPDRSIIIRSNDVPGLPNEEAAMLDALRNPISSRPLAELVDPGKKVCIVHTDITRATPNDRLLPVIIRELEEKGVSSKDVFLLNGLGTHRPQTQEELESMLGIDLVKRYRCLQHNAWDEKNLVDLGVNSFGNPVRLNRSFLGADIKILTGFIEPHFFAGFSGGPKAVLPAIAGYESVWTNHSSENINHPASTWAMTNGNPIWEEMLDVALNSQPDFLVNVTMNAEGNITAVFAGNMIEAHAMGCQFVKRNSMVPVQGLFDIVITTNGGYPLDQNLYQSIKGMSAASRIVKPGGSIISLVACEDGIPNHSSYQRLLYGARSPQDLLRQIQTPGFKEPDQWQVQIQAIIQQEVDVYVYSDGLSDEDIQCSLFIPCRDIGALIDRLTIRFGREPSIAVLPEGPQTIPFLQA